MDYETKIYLDNLIEAVDSPDWWGFGATVFVGIVAAGITWILGRRQNELQEQQLKIQERQNVLQEQQIKLQEKQTKQQEYEIYRSLYKLVRSANVQIDKFLDVLWEVVWTASYQFEPDFLKNREAEINKLFDDLNENITDYELKFTRDFFDNNAYYNILKLMTRIYRDIMWAKKNDRINYVEGMQRDYSRSKDKDAELIGAISRRFEGEGLQSSMESSLTVFVELKRSVYNNNVLNQIRERCKID